MSMNVIIFEINLLFVAAATVTEQTRLNCCGFQDGKLIETLPRRKGHAPQKRVQCDEVTDGTPPKASKTGPFEMAVAASIGLAIALHPLRHLNLEGGPIEWMKALRTKESTQPHDTSPLRTTCRNCGVMPHFAAYCKVRWIGIYSCTLANEV